MNPLVNFLLFMRLLSFCDDVGNFFFPFCINKIFDKPSSPILLQRMYQNRKHEHVVLGILL